MKKQPDVRLVEAFSTTCAVHIGERVVRGVKFINIPQSTH